MIAKESPDDLFEDNSTLEPNELISAKPQVKRSHKCVVKTGVSLFLQNIKSCNAAEVETKSSDHKSNILGYKVIDNAGMNFSVQKQERTNNRMLLKTVKEAGNHQSKALGSNGSDITEKDSLQPMKQKTSGSPLQIAHKLKRSNVGGFKGTKNFCF